MCVQNRISQPRLKRPLFASAMMWCFSCRGWKFSMATQVAMQNSGSYSIAQFQSRMIRYAGCSISFLCSLVKPISFPDGATSGAVMGLGYFCCCSQFSDSVADGFLPFNLHHSTEHILFNRFWYVYQSKLSNCNTWCCFCGFRWYQFPFCGAKNCWAHLIVICSC